MIALGLSLLVVFGQLGGFGGVDAFCCLSCLLCEMGLVVWLVACVLYLRCFLVWVVYFTVLCGLLLIVLVLHDVASFGVLLHNYCDVYLLLFVMLTWYWLLIDCVWALYCMV